MINWVAVALFFGVAGLALGFVAIYYQRLSMTLTRRLVTAQGNTAKWNKWYCEIASERDAIKVELAEAKQQTTDEGDRCIALGLDLKQAQDDAAYLEKTSKHWESTAKRLVAQAEQWLKEVNEARESLSSLSLFLCQGMGDERTTISELCERIKAGVNAACEVEREWRRKAIVERDNANARCESRLEDIRNVTEKYDALKEERDECSNYCGELGVRISQLMIANGELGKERDESRAVNRQLTADLSDATRKVGELAYYLREVARIAKIAEEMANQFAPIDADEIPAELPADPITQEAPPSAADGFIYQPAFASNPSLTLAIDTKMGRIDHHIGTPATQAEVFVLTALANTTITENQYADHLVLSKKWDEDKTITLLYRKSDGVLIGYKGNPSAEQQVALNKRVSAEEKLPPVADDEAGKSLDELLNYKTLAIFTSGQSMWRWPLKESPPLKADDLFTDKHVATASEVIHEQWGHNPNITLIRRRSDRVLIGFQGEATPEEMQRLGEMIDIEEENRRTNPTHGECDPT